METSFNNSDEFNDSWIYMCWDFNQVITMFGNKITSCGSELFRFRIYKTRVVSGMTTTQIQGRKVIIWRLLWEQKRPRSPFLETICNKLHRIGNSIWKMTRRQKLVQNFLNLRSCLCQEFQMKGHCQTISKSIKFTCGGNGCSDQNSFDTHLFDVEKWFN